MLLAILVSTKSQAVAAAKRCQTQAHAGHETARIIFQPPDIIFQLWWQETELWGLPHCSHCIAEEIQHLREGREVASFCCVKRGGSDLDHAPFERCVLERERMETWGNSLRFWNRKCIKRVKWWFRREICYFVGGKFSYAGCIKRVNCNVNQMGQFCCFCILTS
jgi:hypothetical protein